MKTIKFTTEYLKGISAPRTTMNILWSEIIQLEDIKNRWIYFLKTHKESLFFYFRYYLTFYLARSRKVKNTVTVSPAEGETLS